MAAYGIFLLAVPRTWPRRLLHIPSMTSLERCEGNVYGDDKEPDYAIISYTWGRFQIPEGPRLHVKGIDWEIPAVDPNHFAVPDLEQLLTQVSMRHQYVWIDVACIDQKRYGVKMGEIGRQASIFKLAKQAYVWLNKHEPEHIQRLLNILLNNTYHMSKMGTEASDILRESKDSFSELLTDGWFSSLWTLQESVLHRHAILLDRGGRPVLASGQWRGAESDPHIQLLDLSGCCSMLRHMLDQLLLIPQQEAQQRETVTSRECATILRMKIHESGLDFNLCPNPNVQYAAARFRQTSRPEDRIYAIMQVYGYSLGDSAKSKWSLRCKRCSLKDLEMQFSRTITSNPRYVILSQAFQHLATPIPGQSWSILNAIRVPNRFHNFNRHEHFISSACSISVHQRDKAYFRGAAWSLQELLEFWSSRSRRIISVLESRTEAPAGLEERGEYFQKSRLLKMAKQGVIMDHSNGDGNSSLTLEWPPDTASIDSLGDPVIESRGNEMRTASEAQQAWGERLLAECGQDTLKVLYLGRVRYIERMEFALIVVRLPSGRNCLRMPRHHVYKRIGVCFWYIEGNGALSIEDRLRPLEGKFG